MADSLLDLLDRTNKCHLAVSGGGFIRVYGQRYGIGPSCKKVLQDLTSSERVDYILSHPDEFDHSPDPETGVEILHYVAAGADPE